MRVVAGVITNESMVFSEIVNMVMGVPMKLLSKLCFCQIVLGLSLLPVLGAPNSEQNSLNNIKSLIGSSNYQAASQALDQQLSKKNLAKDENISLQLLRLDLALKTKDPTLRNSAYEELLSLKDSNNPEWESLLYDYYVSLVKDGDMPRIRVTWAKYPSQRFVKDFYPNHGRIPPLAHQLPDAEFKEYCKVANREFPFRGGLESAPVSPGAAYRDQYTKLFADKWNAYKLTGLQPAVSFLVDAEGKVYSLKVVRSSGVKSIDDKATDLINSISFAPPPLRTGAAVYSFSVDFSWLKNVKKEKPAFLF
jgi:TonB family protein